MSGRRFTVVGTNNAFTCGFCGAEVQPLRNGSVRNHCPECLHSRHVDILPGDRACTCQGDMEPVAVEQSGKKGWIITHRCQKCGFEGRNRAATDDPDQPDSWDALIAVSTRRRD
ncbi:MULTISPECIES: RNHCP domain-containing protein [unclassified Deinococcus]|uniref:RNHCP domain-containing protein n=1 Tax=unclassified Deinococcus TaxID=2623546 RepID=UPI000C1A379B|nr:RNHCP domain-containing protein [Deinococcus sp. UR1]MBX8463841.1 RNHCP domain-containing protein [Deinococcus sp. RIT780]MCD0159150.1 RNHCP domain-containing protein [Deinococcus sp. 6GRE01]PIG99421.1 RNHCP domain-containing protein [Deinococcus sp. UR1]